MRKLIGLLTAVLCLGVFSSAIAETRWVTERLAIRTLKAATADGGANDSLTASLGAAATLDTTVAFKYPVRSVPALGDSQNVVIVNVAFNAAIASGESLMVHVEASGDNGNSWRLLNSGSIPFGAPISGQVQQGQVIVSGKANSATNVTMFSPVLPANTAYGAWFGWPKLRLKIGSDRSAAMVANSYQVWVSYVTDK